MNALASEAAASDNTNKGKTIQPVSAVEALTRAMVPHSIEAEKALLGALLISPQQVDRLSGTLAKDDFFEPLHQSIFESIRMLLESGRQATPITLEPLLTKVPAFGPAGGFEYLSYLATSTPSVSSAPDLARLIIELATRRRLMLIGEEIVLDAQNTETDLSPNQQIEAAERRLYSIAESGRFGGGFQHFRDAAYSAINLAEEAYKREGELTGLSTGLQDLDRLLGGLQPSDLLVLAGRPAMGKTALATNIAVSVAQRLIDKNAEASANRDSSPNKNGGVGFFSLEMSSEQLATRVISEHARVGSSQIRRGSISGSQFDRLIDTARDLNSLPLYIDETGGLSVGQLAARARRLKRQHGLSLIIVDYIQLLRGAKANSESRTQEVTEITTTLKSLAKELQVPILALSQLSRQVENREGNRPQLADLRESGSIEQDADVVMFVYRREYYLERDKPDEGDTEAFAKWQRSIDSAHGKAEIIFGKHRHGPTGSVMLAFHAEHTRFADLAIHNVDSTFSQDFD